MTDEERVYYIERCLRLEAELARALGLSCEIILPAIKRRSLYDDTPPFHISFRDMPVKPAQRSVHSYRPQRKITSDDAAKMRDLRRTGLSYEKIGARLQFSPSTVRIHTFDVEKAT